MSCKNCFLPLLALVLQNRSWLIFKETPDYWNNTETNLTVWKPIVRCWFTISQKPGRIVNSVHQCYSCPFLAQKKAAWIGLSSCANVATELVWDQGAAHPACRQPDRSDTWYLMTENCKSDCKETGKPWSRYSFHICPLKELTGIILIIFSHIIQRICLQPFQPFDTWEGFIMLLLVSFFFSHRAVYLVYFILQELCC